MTEELLPPLARSALDRDYLSRENPELFDRLWEEPDTKVLVLFEGKALIHSPSSLRLLSVEQVPVATTRVYLGRSVAKTEFANAGAAIVLAIVGENAALQLEPNQASWQSLRAIGGGLAEFDAGIFTQALALSNWHQTHQHCPGCGTPTVVERGGWVRRCLKDNREHFPRTDPAIIVAIIDQHDRILLGSQASWEVNRWSILAGFVEPGESLEAAVIREMKEECGLEVANPVYIYSQGWPYPASLMLGYTATADSTKSLRPDGEEIARLRWFSREELLAEAKDLLLPNYSTISRALIERWYGGRIDSATEYSSNGQQ